MGAGGPKASEKADSEKINAFSAANPDATRQGAYLAPTPIPLPLRHGELLGRECLRVGGCACDAMTFNPLLLPAGIKPSADPLLNARAAPCAISLGRRLGEAAKK